MLVAAAAMWPILFIALAFLAPASYCRVVDIAAHPAMTPAPRVDVRQAQTSSSTTTPMNPISLAQVLITAVPESLRMIVATNLPEASKIIWSEFLDGNRPSWFTGLPTDIQTYLVNQFAPSTSQPSTTTTSSSSSSTSSQPASTAALTTAYVTTTVAAQPQSTEPSSGLSTADKIGIGLGIPLALLAIAVLILACCLVRVLRRNRKAKVKHAESRPPTPAFLSSTMVPKPTTSVRGGGGSRTSLYRDSFEDSPPAAATGAKRLDQGVHHPYGPLLAVPEDENENLHDTDRKLHAQSPLRRSRGSILDTKDTYSSTSINSIPDGIHETQPYSPVSSTNPVYGSPDWQNQHPALRTDVSPKHFGAPAMARSSIPRKPVAAPGPNRIGNFEHQYTAGPGPGSAEDALLPSPQTTRASPRRSDWPLSHSNNQNGNSYWKVQSPNYDRYERTYDGCR